MQLKPNTPLKVYAYWKLIFLFILFYTFNFASFAQHRNPIPFKHRVGESAPEGNIFRIKGDFTIIGNSNLKLLYHTDSSFNSYSETLYTDIDDDQKTFNSSSATLVFSEENNADPNCSEIRYAGLYWSGRTVPDTDVSFEITKNVIPGETIHFINEEFKFSDTDLDENDHFMVSFFKNSDENEKATIIISILDNQYNMLLSFNFHDGVAVEYTTNGYEYINVQNLKIKTENGITTATFTPIEIKQNDLTFSFGKLTIKEKYEDPLEAFTDTFVHVVFNGSHTPILPYTNTYDKRKVKLKGPNANSYTEITADGNAILFPKIDLADIYAGYSDITDYVRTHGLGEYTIADIALQEGYSDNTGFFGNWGIIVVYQNSKMNWRDITIFDGYSFVQSMDGNEHMGEIEISGFGTVNSGPVEMKLGLMAGEGDQPTGGDFLEIIDQKGEWVRLKHPMNTVDNFFNSTIYTPVKNAANQPVPTPRFPNLKNNIGVDIVQWDIENPSNSIITNNQTSTKFRFGTRQDLYAIYLMAFSVLSYIPDVQVLNQPVSINGLPIDGTTPTVEPGQEITYSADIRNLGSEEVKDTKITIPLPYTANFISASTIPSNYGKVTFDPNIGINGTIIWDIGDLPLKQNKEEIIATLNYTIKVTEDCTILANASCETNVIIEGFVSGYGKLSENSFSNLPFAYELKEGACEGEELNTPTEIPIVKRAEYAAANCSNFDGLAGLIPISTLAFCQRDTPVDLIDLIKPTDPKYNVFFFSEEVGGNPFPNYFINTYAVGKEIIWAAQGLEGGCTGPRTPITIDITATAPNPKVFDGIFCIGYNEAYFQVNQIEGYTLNYYQDNSPLSKPLEAVPILDPDKPGLYTVWVSHSKVGECESDRIKVETRVYDCTQTANITIDIVPDINPYTHIDQAITFTITVTNIGDITLSNIIVPETLMNNNWTLPELKPSESNAFTFTYYITAADLESGSFMAETSVTGTSFLGVSYSYNYTTVFSIPDYFKDYEITTEDANCGQNGNNLGDLIVKFKDQNAHGYIEILEEESSVYRSYFDPTNQLKVQLKPGRYQVILTTPNDTKIPDQNYYIIKEPASVEFDLQDENIYACTTYELSLNDQAITFEVFGPSGNSIQRNTSGNFLLTQSGNYKILGKDPNGTKCSLEKTIRIEIPILFELNVEIGSFCQNDYLTNVQLLSATTSHQINWSVLSNNGYISLNEFDELSQIQLTEPGTYLVTTTNQEGCIVGRKTFEISRTQNPEPAIAAFYTICPTKQGNQSITVLGQFENYSWFIGDFIISQEATLYPKENGKYTLVTTDLSGCTFAKEFEVEIKCEPTLIFSNAILSGVDGHGLKIVTDNLIESLSVQVFNRWGELIYTCQDLAPQNGKSSSCFWDGTVSGKRVLAGNYSLLIVYKIKGENKEHKIFDMIMVIE
ncbi:hypothetical protein MM239_12500 [Belliella sp. DSM 111904]|uniref:Uncharacterized protein n=1 Tax=Belliella filtrata TaxID=2923435 RepID=A0ABS9V1Z6_9BACT|nr:hypothetical protein [Belliella filtrata]MCH7410220.1 hypothetical protein [Belliella filtrata]